MFATFQGGNWHRSGLERRVRSYTLRRSAALIIGSSDEAERVRNAYRLGDDRIRRIFNPLDLSEWTPVPRADAAVTSESIPPRVWRSGTAGSTYAERASTSCSTHGGWSNWNDPTMICSVAGRLRHRRHCDG